MSPTEPDGLTQFVQLDARLLMPLIGDTNGPPAAGLLREIRTETIRQSGRVSPATWQELWNKVTGSTPHCPGLLVFSTHVTCLRCNGRRFDKRTGRACMECMARGRVFKQIRLVTRYAQPPAEQR